jgi:acetyl-CoA synthetase
MTEPAIYPVPAEWAARAKVDARSYADLYGRSLADPGSFWLEQAKRLQWIKRPEIAGDWSFDEHDFHIRWFPDGRLNVSANCLDRHLATQGDAVAIIWEPDAPDEEPRRLTYRQLHAEVCRFANVLKASPPMRWPAGSAIAIRRSSSPQTRGGAAGGASRSRPMSMRRRPTAPACKR